MQIRDIESEKPPSYSDDGEWFEFSGIRGGKNKKKKKEESNERGARGLIDVVSL